MMIKRTSKVDQIKVNVVELSANIQIGDTQDIDAFSRTIAVQKEEEIFYGDEHSFNQYSLFSEPMILPPITETVYSKTVNENGYIHVNSINVLGISAASVLQIGNVNYIYLENRRKHIRHLNRRSKATV